MPLYYVLTISLLLLGIKIVLFIGALFLRPKVLNQYPYMQRINIALNPFKSGKAAIRTEDREALRRYRTVWLAIEVLVLFRFVIGMALWAIGSYKPELLCGEICQPIRVQSDRMHRVCPAVPKKIHE